VGGIFLEEFFEGIFFLYTHTKFLEILEYLRVGEIFRGNSTPTNSSEAKNAGGEYPISPGPLEDFGVIFLTNKNFLSFISNRI
jgi:hypothetical protein